jgi:hypothetical protein
MSRTTIDIIVAILLFISGIAWTVGHYGKRDRVAFTIVAILSPALAVFALFRLLFLVVTRKVTVGPCPPGLTEAERMVEQERQRMFGGELRQPSFGLRWQRAYELELQREAEGVQRVATRVLMNA